MIRFLYNILFWIFFLLSAPFYFLKMWRRGNWAAGFNQRFARYDIGIRHAASNRDVLWLHAVSVGEVNILTQLIAALEPRLPNLKLVVSTTTSTGMAELSKRLPTRIIRIYYPVDGRRIVRRALSKFALRGLVLVEAEIWPNFLWELADRQVPVFLVNTRLSEKSHRGYKRLGFLFRGIFASFAGVGVQNETDAARAIGVGCRPEAVHVVGNLKFDAARLDSRTPFNVAGLLRQLHVPPGAPVIVAGSTHAGEEALLAAQVGRLRQKHPGLFLVLVPRHVERTNEVVRDLKAAGVKFCLRTDVVDGREFKPGEIECLVVNTTGELRHFYQHASVIFVGKSLTAEGGQNPIEPGALGKAMVFGPNMQNFTAIANAFVSRRGAVQVPDAPELERAFDELLADESRRAELGRNALAVVRENQGAIERTVDMIVEHLHLNGTYVAGKR